MKAFFESIGDHESAAIEASKMNDYEWAPGYLEQSNLSLAEQAVQNGCFILQATHIYNQDHTSRHLALLMKCVRALAHKVQRNIKTTYNTDSFDSVETQSGVISYPLNGTNSTQAKSGCERDIP